MGRRGRVAVGLVALAVAVVIVAGAVVLSGGDDATPVGAVAAVQDDHLPVDPIDTIPARLDMIAATGVTTTRVDLFWKDIAPSRPTRPSDPADPAYDFARADLIMLGLAKRDITPIVSVYNAPRWATGGPPSAAAVNPNSPDPEDFGQFMGTLAARYSGGFISPGGEKLPEVRHFEIWNEPNLSAFFSPQFEGDQPVSLDTYAAMDRAAYPEIKKANADAVVIVGVGGPRSSTSETGFGATDWLKGLRERNIPLDAYSQHVYPAAPPLADTTVVPSWATIGRVLDELDAWKPGLPLYITEAGYTTATTPYRTEKVTEEQQAEYLTEIYSLPQLRSDRVKAVVWFNLQDNVNWPAGLMREDLSRKPSYEAFTRAVDDQGGARLGG
jgi:polysaccharide biosynthesis protein PslG